MIRLVGTQHKEGRSGRLSCHAFYFLCWLSITPYFNDFNNISWKKRLEQRRANIDENKFKQRPPSYQINKSAQERRHFTIHCMYFLLHCLAKYLHIYLIKRSPLHIIMCHEWLDLVLIFITRTYDKQFDKTYRHLNPIYYSKVIKATNVPGWMVTILQFL